MSAETFALRKENEQLRYLQFAAEQAEKANDTLRAQVSEYSAWQVINPAGTASWHPNQQPS